MITKGLIAVIFIVGCSTSREGYVERAYPGNFPETYSSTKRTPGGVRYNGEADEKKLDFVVDSTFQCFREQFPSGKLPSSEKRSGYCQTESLEYPRKSEFVVVVAESALNCTQKEQVLTVEAPRSGCIAKGRVPTEECPCRWRSGFREARDGTLLFITTPSMFMLSDALARYVSSCQNPWVTEQVIVCARPRVTPLP